MAAINLESIIRSAAVFNPSIEGWSETVGLYLTEEVDGYEVDKETGEKVYKKVKEVSFFIGDVIKGLSANADVAAFLAAKKREERLKLIPVLLANAKLQHEAEHDQTAGKMLRTITSIEVADVHMARIQKALDSLFGF